MTQPTIYVFINKSLHMSTGKVSAQAVHAAMMVALGAAKPERDSWHQAMHRTVLIMEARDQEHIINLKKYLEERGIENSRVIIDEGVNEIDSHVITALATPILDKDDPNTDLAMSTFKLYKDMIKTTLEFER
jgi:peptidyl-tRNA hydrolase